MKLYVVRHGETDWNLAGRFQGSKDIELNEKGRRQSRALAAWFRDKPLDYVYSSSLKRAYATASGVAEAKGLPVIKEERLNEINCGDWEGKTWAEITREYPELSASYGGPGGGCVPMPNGESHDALKERAMSALGSITDKGGQNVLIVSHGGTIRAALCGMFGLDISMRSCFEVYNSGIGIFEYNAESGRYKMIRHNSVEHLN